MMSLHDPKEFVKEAYGKKDSWRIDNSSRLFRTESEMFGKFFSENRGGRALDIGAGRGRFTRIMSGFYDDVVSADFSREMLSSIIKSSRKSEMLNVHPVLCDAESLPFVNGAFDAVVAAQVIGHLPRPGEFIKEIERVLKDGSRAIISTGNSLSIENIARHFLSLLGLFGRESLRGLKENTPSYMNERRSFWIKKQQHCRDSFFDIKRYCKDGKIGMEKILGAGLFPLGPLKGILSRSFPFKYFSRLLIVVLKAT